MILEESLSHLILFKYDKLFISNDNIKKTIIVDIKKVTNCNKDIKILNYDFLLYLFLLK